MFARMAKEFHLMIRKRESYMSDHDLLILVNELGKKITREVLTSISSNFSTSVKNLIKKEH